uniref:Uncharacterized protein n=1 Tax=Heliothis virescens TaxID=7102 RepID=A0A2A4J7Q5_HELVI
MSTRSGKRIHTSLLEDTAPTEPEPPAKSERKTRSKRGKENPDDLSISLFKNKKRNNYVSYPTDDELLSDAANKKEIDAKTSRVLRKNALKEQNPVETGDLVAPSTEAKNLIRKSRRGKKVDDAEDTENHEDIPTELTEVPKSKKGKKKKKTDDNPPPTEEVPTKTSKKKKKKGKKTSSMIIEDITPNDTSKNALNRSTMSVDSFHSAAGSPYKNNEKVNKSPFKHNKKLSNQDKNDASENMTPDEVSENQNNTFNKDTARKSLSKEATVVDCFVSVARDNLNDILNVSNISNGPAKRRKSSKKDATFDQINGDNVAKDDESNLNTSRRLSRRRQSLVNEVKEIIQSEDTNNSINNDTFDKGLKRRNSVAKDITFDKSNVSITKDTVDKDVDLNVSNKVLKNRRSMVKDTTFDKSNTSMTREDSKIVDMDLNVSNRSSKARKSILKDSTFDKSNASITNGNVIDKVTDTDLNVSNKQLGRRKSVIKDTTFDKQETLLNTTFEKDNDKKKDSTFDKSSKHLDVTYEKVLVNSSLAKGKDKSSINTTYDKTDKSDATFEKDISASFDAFKKGAMTRKSSIRDATFDKSNLSIASLTKEDFEKDKNIISSSATKRRSIRRSTFDKTSTSEDLVNRTFEKQVNTENELKRKSPRRSKSEDIQTILNTTFEKVDVEESDNIKTNSKSSLISSDNSSVTDKSDISRISITSDDTSENIENIVNTTPLLIESSLDESHVSVTKPDSPKPQTPLKREGTFTKESPETQPETEVTTPSKRKSSVPTAGCTPYHITKSSQKKSMMNVTRSIEKGPREVDPAPRMTRVMFCSPVDNPVAVAQEKRKIIKSNLKGSNKSFVFEDSASIPRPGRKRSYTHSDVDDARVKRTRLTEDLQQSVDRLSRPRTASATGKLAVVTPKKATTPSKPKSDSKVSRTKLPNFAALHQKQFAKMESLDECQERRAKRAKQLLTPTAPPGLLDRISPKNTTDSPKPKEPATNQKPKDKTDTPTKKPPTLESLRPGFTRFGFKLNLDVNPFSIPSKSEKAKEKPVEKPNGVLPRPAILPSLTGATSVRREVAKSTVMREKSFTERRNVKRNENRTVIKGVRTNRRFELQMKLRNLE